MTERRMYWSKTQQQTQAGSEKTSASMPAANPANRDDADGGAQWVVYLVVAVVGLLISVVASQGWAEEWMQRLFS